MTTGDQTRSRSAAVPAQMREALVIADYTPADDEEALDLDRRCAQGGVFRLSFERTTFRRRAENFREWRILTARLDGVLVGTIGAALKDVTLLGEQTRAAFIFDLRVHPPFRRMGIAKRLSEEILGWAFLNARVAYTYVVADNRITRHLAAVLGATLVADYEYLVYPTFRPESATSAVESATFEDVHEGFLGTASSLDFYANPECHRGGGGYVDSWFARRDGDVAGCSCWSNRGILGEVVERIPLSLRIAGQLLRAWPISRHRWPHVPRPGEELRSWYVFDFFASNAQLACEVMRRVESEAVRQGIDYCYIIHQPGAAWLSAVRADVPRLFAPTIRYRLLARTAEGPLPEFDRIYVDIRDL
jgi:GNAT superfamily N-acetyltransferase